MNILVCVKQVPEPDALVSIDDDARWVTLGGGSTFRMNRFDECAVESAVQIKEQSPETRIHILSVGPERAETVIRRAIGMGADDGTHIVTSGDGFVDPLTLAQWMATAAGTASVDLVLCGAMSEDLMQGQVGPLLAECLGLPCATAVVHMDVHPDDACVYVDREIEGGYRETLVLQLPALLTIQTGINQPRYPSLSKLLRANRQSLTLMQADGMDTKGPLQSVDQVIPPRKLRDGVFLEGSTDHKAEQLVGILYNRSLLS
jgi:electron transfer flavoprotein beta subunit